MQRVIFSACKCDQACRFTKMHMVNAMVCSLQNDTKTLHVNETKQLNSTLKVSILCCCMFKGVMTKVNHDLNLFSMFIANKIANKK